MELRIIPGTKEHLFDCIECFKHSELGDAYFTTDEIMISRYTEGLGKGEIFVALDENRRCLGYIWIAFNGMFHHFPYCKVLAVKKEFRGRGIGTALMNYFEKAGFAKSNRVFILVSHFNNRAEKLYKRLGYTQVGLIPDLFKEGISEYLLVKFR